MVRDIRILTGLDRFCPLLNVYSWYSKKKKSARDILRPGFLGGKKLRAWPKKLPFFKISDFDEDNIVKVDIDHVVCEEIAATDG